jgi:hypothetical protein
MRELIYLGGLADAIGHGVAVLAASGWSRRMDVFNAGYTALLLVPTSTLSRLAYTGLVRRAGWRAEGDWRIGLAARNGRHAASFRFAGPGFVGELQVAALSGFVGGLVHSIFLGPPVRVAEPAVIGPDIAARAAALNMLASAAAAATLGVPRNLAFGGLRPYWRRPLSGNQAGIHIAWRTSELLLAAGYWTLLLNLSGIMAVRAPTAP